MAERCSVCERPRLGHGSESERPCHVPLGPRCYEVAYDRLKARLRAVATEAAAMLAETRHGGLTHARSESLGATLKAAGVPIPPQCPACPHGRDGD